MNGPTQIAERLARIQPFYVMDLLAQARALEAQGRDLVHMEVGEPDFPTPEPILRAGAQALAAGDTHYTPALGLPSLRQAIAGHYRDRFRLDLDRARVAVTPGASGALLLALGVLVNPGDEVLLADPGYPCNRNFVEFLGGRPVGIPVGADSGYQLNAGLVDRAWTPRTRAVLVASPSNPTGTLLPKDQLAELHGLVRHRGGTLILDEIYQELVFDQAPYTGLEVAQDLILINSFSKYYGMTGWRLGWLVAPPELMEPIDRLAQNLFLAPSTLAQRAALAAFSPETRIITEQRRLEFQRRRDFLVPALRDLGLGLPLVPQGAFYLYADCGAITSDSFSFAHTLLDQAGVAVTPGRDFGHHHPERHLRFAYTRDIGRLAEGVERIRRFLG